MLRKIILFASVSIVVIASFLVGYYYIIRDKKTIISQTLSAVPVDASLVFESKNLSTFFNVLTQKSEIWKELNSVATIKKVNSNISFIDSLTAKNLSLKNFTTNRSVVISVHASGRSEFDYLFLVSLNNTQEQDILTSEISNIVKGKGIISERTYNKEKIFDVKLTNKESFSYAFVKGIFFLSYSSFLLEDAVRQVYSNVNLLNDKNFVKVSNSSGKNVDGNIYINYKHFPKLVSIFMNPEYADVIRDFGNFASWSELDLTVKPDAMLLNGFTYSNDSTNNYLNIFTSDSPQRLEFESILPANTATFSAFAFEDFDSFHDKYVSYIDKNGHLGNYKEPLNALKAKYDIDLEEIFNSIVENEVILSYSDVNAGDINQNVYVSIKTKGKENAQETMLEALKKYSQKRNVSLASLIETCEIDEENKYPIYESPALQIPMKMFGTMFSKCTAKYFTFVDNYMVFGNSVNSLSLYIHANILQKTMEKDLTYQKFSENLSSKSNYYFYMNISRSIPIISTFLNESLAESMKLYVETFQKFQDVALQFSAGKEMIYNNFIATYSPVYEKPPMTAWEARLDTNILFKPKLCTNHLNNEKEIFVQDINNTIYLVNETGNVVLKKKLDEKIISEVIQVDVLKNGKLQYLFNTKNKIHLIDRNGNYLEHFPIQLTSPATNGIAVFDYENNRNYRIFIATKDRKVSIYTAQGDKLDGWFFDKTESPVVNEIQYFKVGDKDYIVFADSLNMYVLDRKGNPRAKPKFKNPCSRKNAFVLENGNVPQSACMVTTDKFGNILKIKFDGTVLTEKVKECNAKHFFDYKDINADGKEDYIFVNDKVLEVYNQSKKLLFSYDFQEEITLKPIYFSFSQSDKKLGITAIKSGKIYVFNPDGTLYKGFPLKGKTQFSIGYLNPSNKNFNLIVGSDNNFLYNYEVN